MSLYWAGELPLEEGLLPGFFDRADDETRRLALYLLDVQSTHVGILPTRIVIPLRPTPDLGFSGKPSDLLPVFEINGENHFLDTHAMSAVPLTALGRRIELRICSTAFTSASAHQL